jgi:hypothetical protein
MFRAAKMPTFVKENHARVRVRKKIYHAYTVLMLQSHYTSFAKKRCFPSGRGNFARKW